MIAMAVLSQVLQFLRHLVELIGSASEFFNVSQSDSFDVATGSRAILPKIYQFLNLTH